MNFNRVDPDLKSPKTHEIVIGLDRELMPNFGVSAAVTWRRFNDVIWTGIDLSTGNTVYPLVGVTRADYVQEGVVSGTCAGSAPTASLSSRRARRACRRATAASIAIVRAITSSYLGFEVQATKRLSNRWMARVGFSTSSHREYFDDPSMAVQDPTSTTIFPNIDGGVVVTPSSAAARARSTC